jgi:hypothetical protein
MPRNVPKFILLGTVAAIIALMIVMVGESVQEMQQAG